MSAPYYRAMLYLNKTRWQQLLMIYGSGKYTIDHRLIFDAFKYELPIKKAIALSKENDWEL